LLQRTGEQKTGGRAIQIDSLLFGIFFVFFIFPKIYDRFQILQKYTTTAIPHGVWAQQPYHTAAGGAIVFQTPCGVPFMNSTRAVVL
jgi:hypothetical protein